MHGGGRHAGVMLLDAAHHGTEVHGFEHYRHTVWLIKDAKIYDFATVATFTTCLVLLHRQKLGLYLLAYLLAYLNRGTAFLLTVFFVWYFFRVLDRRTYLRALAVRVTIFVIVGVSMLVAFRASPGVVAQVNFFWILQEFSESWIGLMAVILVFSSLTWMILRHW